jgi:hypothetical protein
MPIEVTARAVDVLRRALEAGRLDPAAVGVRIDVGRGLRGEEVRPSFAEQAEPGDVEIEVGGLRLFVPKSLSERGATVDVADEHDRIVIREETSG